MFVLTPENTSLETSLMPNKLNKDVDMRYCVLDYTEPEFIDYRFPIVAWLDEYGKSSIELQIGGYTIQAPTNWSILIGDEDSENMELLPVLGFHGRDFKAFTFNPCAGYMIKFMPIEEMNIYEKITWNIPNLHPTYMIAIPLHGGENPPCVFFAETKNKLPELIDISDVM